MVRQLLLALFIAGIAGSVATTAAQPPGAPAQRPVPPAGRGEPRATPCPTRRWPTCSTPTPSSRRQTELTITDDKYGTFAARLKKLQNVRRRNQRQRQQLVRELFRMAGPRAPVPADETAIRNQLAALRDHDERAAVELRQAYDALDEVLDTRQQARFRMFEEQIERRKLDLLVRARARALQNKPQQ